MSQIGNLLTNKVLRFQLGGGAGVSQYRRDRKSAPKLAWRLRAEIEARRQLQRTSPLRATQSKRPGLVRRFVNTIRKAFGGQ